MARREDLGLAGYAQATNPNADMRFFASVARGRGLTLRQLAAILPNGSGGVGVEPSTVVRHMTAVVSSRDTVTRYEKALGLDNRQGRIQRGPAALTDDDVRYYRGALLRGIGQSDDYADPAAARMTISAMFDGSNAATQRKVIHLFARTGDAQTALSELARLVSKPTPVRAKSKPSDMGFWMIALELRDLGLTYASIQRCLDFIRKEIGPKSVAVRRNDQYLAQSPWGNLVSEDEATRARGRELLELENRTGSDHK